MIKRNKQAFTLIELLVVILIIGILAAVAVPQYTKAAQKAQFSKLRVMADSLAKTVHAYYLSNGNWPTSLDELDVTLPVDMSSVVEQPGGNNFTCASNSEMFCCIMWPRVGWNRGGILCGQADYSFAYYNIYADQKGVPINSHACSEFLGDVFCRTLPGAIKNTFSAMITPEGFKSGNTFVGYDID